MAKKSKKPVERKAEPVGPILTKSLKEEFIRFIEYHPAKRFTKNLRTMLLEFLMYDGAIEATYLDDLLYDLEALFELLDVIQNELEPKK